MKNLLYYGLSYIEGFLLSVGLVNIVLKEIIYSITIKFQKLHKKLKLCRNYEKEIEYSIYK